MTIGFGISLTAEVDKQLKILNEKEKKLKEQFSNFVISPEFDDMTIGIICVWEKANKFHGVLPVVSKKKKSIAFGIRLDHEVVKNLPVGEKVWEYIVEQIEQQINVLDDIRSKSIDKELLKKRIVEAVKAI